jgi:hypothetical protein
MSAGASDWLPPAMSIVLWVETGFNPENSRERRALNSRGGRTERARGYHMNLEPIAAQELECKIEDVLQSTILPRLLVRSSGALPQRFCRGFYLRRHGSPLADTPLRRYDSPGAENPSPAQTTSLEPLILW